MPCRTRPKTVCFPSNHGHGTVVTSEVLSSNKESWCIILNYRCFRPKADESILDHVTKSSCFVSLPTAQPKFTLDWGYQQRTETRWCWAWHVYYWRTSSSEIQQWLFWRRLQVNHSSCCPVEYKQIALVFLPSHSPVLHMHMVWKLCSKLPPVWKAI